MQLICDLDRLNQISAFHLSRDHQSFATHRALIDLSRILMGHMNAIELQRAQDSLYAMFS